MANSARQAACGDRQHGSQKWDFVAIQAFGIGTLTDPVNKMIDAGIPVFDIDTLIAPLDTSTCRASWRRITSSWAPP